MWNKVQETVKFLKNKGILEPDFGIILGTGLGNLVEKINISISANGDYAINESPLRTSAIDNIVTNLRNAANSIKDPVIIISADSDSPHQSVINVMEAARIAGLTKITFSTKVK